MNDLPVVDVTKVTLVIKVHVLLYPGLKSQAVQFRKQFIKGALCI